MTYRLAIDIKEAKGAQYGMIFGDFAICGFAESKPTALLATALFL